MKGLIQQVDSVHHLVSFEAAARHMSFTKAAAELGVSQPAVSQSIRKLEDALGRKLFKRLHRRLKLTDGGALLNREVSKGFQGIAEAVKNLRALEAPSSYTLMASSALINYWLMPRMAQFSAQCPGVDLRLQSQQLASTPLANDLSFIVKRGHGQWRGYDAVKVAQERVCIVASPHWLRNHPIPATIESLNDASLIHARNADKQAPSWADWFSGMGWQYGDHGQGRYVEDQALVLQAAIAGKGLALGPEHIVADLVAQGLLVKVSDWCWDSGFGYYLLWDSDKPLSAQAMQIRDWFLLQMSPQASVSATFTETSFDFLALAVASEVNTVLIK